MFLIFEHELFKIVHNYRELLDFIKLHEFRIG